MVNHTSANRHTASMKKLKVAFIHPDLGIGGAERLIVDAAVGLSKNHEVIVFTSHHSPDHCFAETKDGTLNVKVYGDWIPRTIFGYFHVLCAILRMIYVAWMVILFYGEFDVIICDQVSAHIPLLKWFTRAKIVFYCHHPDKLLIQGKKTWLKKLYRIPFDWLEEVTTEKSHRILVNSKYTAQVFKSSFPSIKVEPTILYPSLNLQSYDKVPAEKSKLNFKGKKVLVSINRFERKKEIPLAVETFALLKERLPKGEFEKLVLVLAGGYDERVPENREVLQDLKKRVQQYNLEEQTIFLPSFSNADRYVLLHESLVVLYTPQNEHFGIVPIEAQYCGRGIVAVNSGGPLESIIHGKTGFLAEPNPNAFADAVMIYLKNSEKENAEMGKFAREHVKKNFSLDAFTKNLENILYEVTNSK